MERAHAPERVSAATEVHELLETDWLPGEGGVGGVGGDSLPQPLSKALISAVMVTGVYIILSSR